MSQTPAQIAEFLSKLDNDDSFRNELVCDPGTVFARYNITYDPNNLPKAADIRLPAKGEVTANYSLYEAQLFPGNDFSSNDLLIELTP